MGQYNWWYEYTGINKEEKKKKIKKKKMSDSNDMAQGTLYQHHNTDNIFNRSVIGGLLNLLNNKIVYEQTWQDNVVEKVSVPFAYNFGTSEERFAQDNYTFFGRECFSNKLIDGKFDMLPRFALSYTGSQIDAANITNRFVKGEYTKEENGVVKSYTAFMYSIPLTLNFECEGWVDNYDTAFKIEQTIRDVFYKNKTFNVLYRGMKIGCCAGFPETITAGENTVTYSFDAERQLKMKFSLSVETYQPCFDESTSIEGGNTIQYFGYEINRYNNAITPLNKQVYLKFNPLESNVISRGSHVRLRWSYNSDSADVIGVVLYYKEKEGDEHLIDVLSEQNGEYEWSVPFIDTNIKQPSFAFIDDVLTSVKTPTVVVVPDKDGDVLTDCFSILNGGEFDIDGYVQISCDYVDSNGNVKFHDCYIGEVVESTLKRIYYYEDIIDSLPDGYDFKIVNKKPLHYNEGESSSKITLGVRYIMNKDVYDEIYNVMVI